MVSRLATALVLLVACAGPGANQPDETPPPPEAASGGDVQTARAAPPAAVRRPEPPARRCSRCQREYAACVREEGHLHRTGAASCGAGFRQCLAPASSPTSADVPATDEGLATCRAPGDNRNVPVLDPSFPSRTLLGP